MYLDPSSIAVIDEFEQYSKISRSKIIREAIDRMAFNLGKILVKTEKLPRKKFALDDLVGIVDIKDKNTTNYAQKEDIYYLAD
jgi:hypothetical protein